MRKKSIPEFASEDKELAFWDEHDLEEFEHESAEDILLSVRPEPMKAVTLRMEPSLILRLKRIADKEDLPYQALIRTLVKRGLDYLERAS